MSSLNLTQELLFNRHDSLLPLYHYRGKMISRKQMAKSVSGLASHLVKFIEPGDCVVIYMNDCPSLVSAFLATMACGGVPAVVNPKIKADGLNHVLELTDAKLVFTSLDKATYIPHNCDFEVLYDDEDSASLLSSFSLGVGDSDWNDFVCSPESATSYLQFTSGSTGLPKAVEHSASGTLSFCRAVACSWLSLTSADICYSVPKLFFGYGMGNSLFFPLFSGASAILDSDWPSPNRILANIVEYRPSVLFAGPAILTMLRESSDDVVSVVEKIVSAGAVLSSVEEQFWAHKGAPIKNGFGATELGHIFLASHNENLNGSALNSMLDGYQYKLVDNDGNEIGEANKTGALLVKGPSISPGYLNQPRVTESKFQKGWYRTGDLFELDSAGGFNYLGREDDLFKVNGRWVVPSVVEASLTEHFQEISEAVLVPSSHSCDEKPTLYLSGKSIPQDSRYVETVKLFIRETHASYMEPKTIIQLDAIPRNANGKLNRNSLVELAKQYANKTVEAEICD